MNTNVIGFGWCSNVFCILALRMKVSLAFGGLREEHLKTSTRTITSPNEDEAQLSEIALTCPR